MTTLADVQAHSWHMIISRDGAHFAAAVYRVHAEEPCFQAILKDTADDAIDSAAIYISTFSPVTARSLRGLATFEVQRRMEAAK